MEIIIMTNVNYTHLSNQQMVDIVNSLNTVKNVKSVLVKNHMPDLYSEICRRTQFIDDAYVPKGWKVEFASRLYCLEHNLTSLPVCENPNCSHQRPVRWARGYGFRHHCCKKCSKNDPKVHEKMKQTNLKRIGVEYQWQSKQVLEKVQETNLTRIGVRWPGQSEKCREKYRNTNMKRIGVEYPTQSQKIKEQILQKNNERYGGIGFASKELSSKVKQKMQDKYGVDNIAKSFEYHRTSHKKYTNDKYPDMTFGSNWEFKVYDFLTENHIEFEYQPAISFEYEYDGNKHTYHPDFLVNGKIYEIKGDQFFRINESTGKEEMYLPWKGNLSDEEYEYKCGLYEAKHQCMIKNDVIILREYELLNLKESLISFNMNSLLKWNPSLTASLEYSVDDI